jgi:hypothetical protein
LKEHFYDTNKLSSVDRASVNYNNILCDRSFQPLFRSRPGLRPHDPEPLLHVERANLPKIDLRTGVEEKAETKRPRLELVVPKLNS